MKATTKIFGYLGSKPVHAIMLTNDNGIEVTCIDYGCTITKIVTPDQDGNYQNIVLGFDQLDKYVNESPYFGCIVGRVAGRSSGAEFYVKRPNIFFG